MCSVHNYQTAQFLRLVLFHVVKIRRVKFHGLNSLDSDEAELIVPSYKRQLDTQMIASVAKTI